MTRPILRPAPGRNREHAAPAPSSIRALWLAFYSPHLYREVARRWRGIGALYLLCLLVGCWAAYMLAADFALTHLLEDSVMPIVRQLPPVSIRDGEVSVRQEQPVFILHPESRDILAILDTTGEHTTLHNTDAWLLLTETHLTTKRSHWQSQTVSLENVKEFYVDGPLLAHAFQVAKRWFVIGAFPVAVGVSFGYRIALALLFGLIALGFAKILGASIRYGSAVRLSVVAMTPALILDTAVSVTVLLQDPRESVPFWWLICFGVSLAYLFGAVAANAGGRRGDW